MANAAHPKANADKNGKSNASNATKAANGEPKPMVVDDTNAMSMALAGAVSLHQTAESLGDGNSMGILHRVTRDLAMLPQAYHDAPFDLTEGDPKLGAARAAAQAQALAQRRADDQGHGLAGLADRVTALEAAAAAGKTNKQGEFAADVSAHRA